MAGLEIGDSVHAHTLNLPDGVELTITDRDFTILTIAAPTVMAAEDEETEGEEGEEGVEGEEGAEGAEGDSDAGGGDKEESGD